MQIDTESIISTSSDSDVDQESTHSGNDESLVQELPLDSIWDRIAKMTWSNNKDFWYKQLSKDPMIFRMKFKECFIETCKTMLTDINDFVENDETWNTLMETKTKLYEDISENDEALLSAIDTRKYKLLKTIDWVQVEAELQDDSDDEAENGANE